MASGGSVTPSVPNLVQRNGSAASEAILTGILCPSAPHKARGAEPSQETFRDPSCTEQAWR